MQAVEALQTVLSMAEKLNTGRVSNTGDEDLALAILYSMLNTALPVSKYRAYVEIVGDQPKRSAFENSIAVRDEFTICSVDMAGIVAGLKGLHHVPTHCRVTLFEQRETGADMLSGYTGLTKGHTNWKLFIESLFAIEQRPAAPAPQVNLNPTLN